MNLRTKKAKLAACTVGALSAALLAVSASPASASGTYSHAAYIQGGGSVWSDDWDDEGIVDLSHNTDSNATCLWQKVLWADGFLPASGIDGRFGSDTYNATKKWQALLLSDSQADGSAGKNTFTKAGTWLRDTDLDGQVDTYKGMDHNVSMTRDSDGHYHFVDGGGHGRVAGYNYLTCS